ncbi:MAG: hypothetical protein ACOX8S_09465 [Christensenellales bacterium]
MILSSAAKKCEELAELLGIPVITTHMAKGASLMNIP